ncbi:MAG: cyclic nucleotide-binding domain-containing protein, partial [Bryobacteraceae bacterium]
MPDSAPPSHNAVDRLATHTTLGGVPRQELVWLASHGTLRHLDTGEILSAKGVKVAGLFVILSGRIAIFLDRGAGLQKTLEWKEGDVTGMLPYSRLVSPPGDTVAQEPTVVLAVACEHLREMIQECHETTTLLVHKMVDRARAFTSSDLHQEKMISLGKLSAGLAHELNNPVAAIERGAALLTDRLEESERASRALGAAPLTSSQFAAVEAVRELCASTRPHGLRSPIEEAEREEAIEDWLVDHGLDSDIAGALAETPATLESLALLAEAVHGPPLNAVLRWAAAGCSVRGIASEIQDAAMRISGLVTAIKGFTHMDQATVAEPVDLLSGLRNTILVLKSKARTKSITVALDVEAALPRV